MRKRLALVGVLAVGLALAAFLREPVHAFREEAKETKEKEDNNTTIVKYLAAAGETAEFGRKTKAPEALVTAASMLLKVNGLTGGKLPELEVPVEDEKGKKIDAPAEKQKSFKEQAEDLFDEATVMNVPGTDDLIKAAKARKYEKDDFAGRDVVGGPKQITRKIEIGGVHSFKFKFKPNMPASIVVQSNHEIRFVIIQPGVGSLMNIVCNNGQYFWTPRGKQDVDIEVRVQNMGKLSQYALLVK